MEFQTFERINGRPTKSGDEVDAINRYPLACLVNHPQAIGKTKTRIRRRERHEIRQALRNW